jgi:hypothetical protein
MKSQIVKFIVLSSNDGLQLHSKVSQLWKSMSDGRVLKIEGGQPHVHVYTTRNI